jgi:hypothetical protein
MGEILLLAFTAALNATELAAIMVMLLLPSPERLMVGYWLGAMLTGIASGLVIVFALKGTGAEHTTTHTVGPVVWLVVAALLMVAAFAIAKGEDRRLRERREARHKKRAVEKKTPRWQKALQEGNLWHTFAVGILLSFPGVSYLIALDRLIHLNYSTILTVLDDRAAGDQGTAISSPRRERRRRLRVEVGRERVAPARALEPSRCGFTAQRL